MTSTQIVALVTGGARRIGMAIARDLAANGFAVAVHYHGAREDAFPMRRAPPVTRATVCVLVMAHPVRAGRSAAREREGRGFASRLVPI